MALAALGILYPDEIARVIASYSSSYPATQVAPCDRHSDSNARIDGSFSAQIDSARKDLLEIKRTYAIPGLAVCVSLDKQIIWNEGFGCADIENSKPATTTSRFRIGSISKSLTAIGLMKLVEQGNISLSDPVIKHLPDLPFPEELTIRHLANHQSGIRHYKGLEMLSNIHYRSIEESLAPFINDRPKFNPGDSFLYSTYNYIVLSRLIEKVSQESFQDYTRKRVLNPLGMRHTVNDLPVYGYKGYSSGRNSGKIRPAIEVDLSNKWAGGGFLSTPKDLVLMMDHLDALLGEATRDEMFLDYPLKDGSGTEYGIGFRVTYLDRYKLTLIHHGGSSIGGRAYLIYIPETKLTIALCANNDGGFNPSNHFGIQEVFDLAKNFIDKE